MIAKQIPRKKNSFMGRYTEHCQWIQDQPPIIQRTWLTLVLTQAVPPRSKMLLQYELRNKDCWKVHSYEESVTPVESFEDPSGLRVVLTLVSDNEGFCWVRLLNIYNEDNVTYKTTESRSLKQLSLRIKHFWWKHNQQKTPNWKIQFHVTTDGHDLLLPELNKVMGLCQNIERTFPKKANDFGFNNQTEHQIKVKPDANAFCRAYSNMSFHKRKAVNKILEGLVEAHLVTPTSPNWADPSILFPKNDGKCRLVVDYQSLNKQLEKTCWFLPKLMKWSILCKENWWASSREEKNEKNWKNCNNLLLLRPKLCVF